MRLVIIGLISLCACERPGAVIFEVAPPAERLEGEVRHWMALELALGFDEDVEVQRWTREGRERVRLERHGPGVVVRWLEAEVREGEVEVGPEPAGAAVMVTDDSLEVVGAGPPPSALQRAAAGEWARALELDALQAALLSAPVPARARVDALDAALSTLCTRALGPGARVDRASLVLTGSTGSVAVFDVSLRAHTLSDGVSSSFELGGTLTVARTGALPLSLALEGPVAVHAPQTATSPSLEGHGTFLLSRYLRVLEPPRDVFAGR